MISAVAAMVCALTVLGRGPEALPLIELVDIAPQNASAGIEAFVPRGVDAIFILTTSDVFEAVQESSCRDIDAVRKLASIVVHEEWHIRHGPDERGAYQAQLDTLVRLGVGPGEPVHYGVVQAMVAASRRQRRELVARN